MSFTGAVKKLRMSRKSVWDIDAESVAERIQERRDRIKRRMETAKRMQKLLSLKKSLGIFGEGEDNELRDFVEAAALKGAKHVNNNKAWSAVQSCAVQGTVQYK